MPTGNPVPMEASLVPVDDIYRRIGEKIREARGDRMTQEELGTRVGFSKAHISRLELGRRPIALDDLKRIAAALNKPLSYFLEGIDDLEGMRLDPKFAEVLTHLDLTVMPVYGFVSAGAPVFVMDRPMDYITAPRELLDSATFAVLVRGDSMIQIGIQDGDTLLVRPQDTADPGDIVVARLNGEEYTIKRLAKKGGRYVLEPANPAHPTIEDEFVIVGKVVSMLRRF